MTEQKINIYSIFKSIQGEVNPWAQGRVAVFIRFVGCNLRCSYCDTMYAVSPTQGEVSILTVKEIMSKLSFMEPYTYVTITGGEPMMQQNGLIELVKALLKANKKISIETNGSYNLIDEIHNDNVSWIFDFKLPSSNETDHMTKDWFSRLTNNDFVKFVVGNQSDFDYALNIVREIKEINPTFENFVFSPLFTGTDSIMVESLADWIIAESELSTAIYNLQIHKLIWREKDGEH